ncbi:MAG: carbohydrate binding family 9 domain-containing protein, partial [Pyrinomonadaceae bacterium]|nr:carbohydrate binding family 9 domain-containing protein [Pyrinomonadaceae bacterium]
MTNLSLRSVRDMPGAFGAHAARRTFIHFLFILILAGLLSLQALAQSSAPAGQMKRLASVRSSELPGGSKVMLISDVSLDDYKSYTTGNRFNVRIPQASGLSSSALALQGRGYTDARIEQSGNDIIISFALLPNTAANVVQKFNRLDVVFNVMGQESQPQTASVALTTSDALPSPQETVKAAAVKKVGNIELPPEKAEPVRVPKFEKPPVIDGKLDDDVWKQATVLKDFYQIQPGDNIAPSKPTEVLLGYDSRNLYIAFRAFDEPDKVRATVAKRDNIFSDDYVGFFLDTFNDKRKAFEIFFNPLGVQGDGVITEGRGEDFSVDLLLESKGLINSEGFIVEISIPFKSLRYEAGKDKLWGAHFFRRIKRFNNELDSWMPFSRSIGSDLSQAGHLTGLEGISTERTIELI